jgi:hypothetical protein
LLVGNHTLPLRILTKRTGYIGVKSLGGSGGTFVLGCKHLVWNWHKGEHPLPTAFFSGC